MRASRPRSETAQLLMRMRHTKAALLVFGLGLVIGFVVVVGEFAEWERTAAAVMAVGLAALPVALIADGRGSAVFAWLAARLPHRPRKRPRSKARTATPRRKSPARTGGGRAPRRKPG